MGPASIAVTTGEPAGVGPDIALALFGEPLGVPLTVLGDPGILAARAKEIGADFRPEDFMGDAGGEGGPRLVPVPAAKPAKAGRPDPGNAPYVLAQIDRAVEGCLSGEFAAMVTGPVNKGALSGPGGMFTGHTEYLRERTLSEDATMLFVNRRIRLGLVTTHLPLSEVCAAIDADLVTQKIMSVANGLSQWFGVPDPRILVAGVNPHAGEGGLLGREEAEAVAPAVKQAVEAGIRAAGPVPADTAMIPDALAEADAVLGMYHDQLLPAAKALDFHGTVNVTLGLPFLRTSVDHGTAERLAGTGRANPLNLRNAVRLAAELCEAA